mmetsp:Transcript_27295/g.61682  ORF Transcript_27295/g.61682 Transcript_27295/m.61682 type:complete len:727 (+) Transcript_27295:295-2475(+)
MPAPSKASANERRLEGEEPPRKRRLTFISQGQSGYGHDINLSDVRGGGGEERTGRSFGKSYSRPMISRKGVQNAVTPSPDNSQIIRGLVSRTGDSTNTPRDGLFDDPNEKLRSPRRLFSDRKLSLRGMEATTGRSPAVKPFVRAQRSKRQMAPRPTPSLHQVLKRRRLNTSASLPRVVGGRSRNETPPVSHEKVTFNSKATEDKGTNTDQSSLHDKGVQVDLFAAGMVPFTFMPDARIDPFFRGPAIVAGDDRTRRSPSPSVYNKPSPIVPREPSRPIMIRSTVSPRDSTSGVEGGLTALAPRETDELGVPFDFMSSQSASNLKPTESTETLPACPPSFPKKVALGVKYLATSTVNWMLNRNCAPAEESVRGAVETSREEGQSVETTNETLSSLSESCSDYVLYTSPPSKPSGQSNTRRQSFQSDPVDEVKDSNEFIKRGLPQKPPPSGWETMFQPKDGGWKCKHCFFKNPPEAMTCDSCTALRDEGRNVQPRETELDTGEILEDYDEYFDADAIEADEVKDGEGKVDGEVDGRHSDSGDISTVPDVTEHEDGGSDQEEISGPCKRMKAGSVNAHASPAGSTKPRSILKTPGRIQGRAAASTYDAGIHHVMAVTRDTIDDGENSLSSLQRASSPATVDATQGLSSLRRAASPPTTVGGGTSLQRAAAGARANFSIQSDAPATPGGRSTASDTDGSPMSTISDGSEGDQVGAGKKMRRGSPNRANFD